MKNNMNATKAAAVNVLTKGIQILKDVLGIGGLGARVTRAFRGNSLKEIQASILKALDDDIEALKEAGNTEKLNERLAQRKGLAKLFTLGEFTLASTLGIAQEGIRAINTDLERAFEQSDNAIIGFIRLGYEGIKTGGKVAGNIILWLIKKAVRFVTWLLALFVNAIKKAVNKIKAKKLGDSLVGDYEDDDDFDDFDFDDDEDEPESYYDDQGNLHVIYEDGEVVFTPEQIAEGVGMVNP